MRRVVLILAAVTAVTACTRGDDSADADEQPTTVPADAAAPADEPAADEPAAEEPAAQEPAGEEPAGEEPGAESADDTTDDTSDGPTTTVAATIAPVTTFEVVEVPETGVPGIDSDDAFCAAWSRFGGSWQVIQVAANFAPDPSVVPEMEVVAAPVVAEAYEAMFANWPDELDDERDVVADGYFGPLARRADEALAALAASGAAPDQLAALGAAWVDALAGRDLENPVLTPELSDELWALVDAAADAFTAQRVGFVDDPTMRIVAETPETDAFLATGCPDQGALTGGEIDGS